MSNTTQLPINQTRESDPVYSQFGGEDGLAELVELYVDEMPERIAALVECQRGRDIDALARLAHQLKGASGSYGFMQISTVAAELEQAARTCSGRDDFENVDRLLAQTIDICRRAKAGTP